MARYLLFAIPLVLLLLACGGMAAELLAPGSQAETLAASAWRSAAPPPAFLLGGWLVETLGLTALYLLLQGRSGAWWLDGLVCGWIAWIFRGPLLVLTVTSLTRLPGGPFWTLAERWLIVYTACGLALAFLARRLHLER